MITKDTQVIGVSPRINAIKFGEVLLAAGSPALGESNEMFQAAISAGIDPCYALAFFKHESQFGQLGVCHGYETHSPGNTRTSRIGVNTFVTVPLKGQYVKYGDWATGMRDACVRLSDPNFVYAQRGAVTIGQILPIWAPTSDSNSPDVYIQSVVDSMNEWIGVGSNMTAVPTQTDIGYPVRTHWAYDTGPGRTLSTVNTFVVHDTEGGMASDEQVLTANDSNVASAHALVAPDGSLVFMVPLETTAWTPGNDAVAEKSINIEISGFQSKGYTDAQYHSVAAFFNWCVAQGCPIPATYVGKSGTAGIVGHQDVPNPNQPGKFGGVSGHTDPGPLFDWAKLVNYIKNGGINKVTSESTLPKVPALPYGVTLDSAGALVFSNNIPLNFGFKDAYLTLFGNVPVGADLGAAVIRGAKVFGLPTGPEVAEPTGSTQEFELSTFRYNKNEAAGWQVRLFKRPVTA